MTHRLGNVALAGQRPKGEGCREEQGGPREALLDAANISEQRGRPARSLGVRDAIASVLPVPSGPALHPRLLLSHFIMLKMSFLEESAGVKMDSGDLEISEAECSSEGEVLVKMHL